MNNIPVNYFDSATIGMGILGTGLLRPRPDDVYDWNGTEWVKSNRENEANKVLRANAYKQESDPIFFKWQRGEATQQEWLDKIADILQRFPK